MRTDKTLPEIKLAEAPWTFTDVVQALRFIALPVETPIAGFSIDSRTIAPGEAFIALRGEHSDGHDFLTAAFARGASLAIVEQGDLPALEGQSYLTVPDTRAALLDLAQYARARSSATIIGISGSVGKTTVRAWTQQLLEACGSTVASKRNFNGEIGLPLSLTQLTSTSKFGVFEIGIDRPGSMQHLATLCSPHVAVLAPVHLAHIENFNSAEALAAEKALLFSGLAHGGIAIVDHESYCAHPVIGHLAQEYGASDVLTVGSQEAADAWVISSTPKNGKTEVQASLAGVSVHYTISAAGGHLVYDSLLALITCLCSLYDESFVDIMQTHWNDVGGSLLSLMPSLEPLEGRGAIYEANLPGARHITLIDDSYNANLTSMLSGMQILGSHTQAPRRIAVVGEMYELGAWTAGHHEQVFAALEASSAIDCVYAVGEHCRSGFDHLSVRKRGVWSANVEGILQPLLDDLRNGDVVWVKGSNAVRLKAVCEEIMSQQEEKKERKRA